MLGRYQEVALGYVAIHCFEVENDREIKSGWLNAWKQGLYFCIVLWLVILTPITCQLLKSTPCKN